MSCPGRLHQQLCWLWCRSVAERMCKCNLCSRLLAQKSREGGKSVVCFWKSEKFGTSDASLEHRSKKGGMFIFKREIVGRILPVTEVSALLVEFNVLINVKSHCRILTDAWHFRVNVLWQETWRLPGQEFQNLALAHVLHHVLGFWICQSLTNDKRGEHFFATTVGNLTEICLCHKIGIHLAVRARWDLLSSSAIHWHDVNKWWRGDLLLLFSATWFKMALRTKTY